MDMPTHLWRFGKGGSGANDPEYERRLDVLIEIRKEYFATFPEEQIYIEAGIDLVPLNWVCKRLEEKNENWRPDLIDGCLCLPRLEN
jgi:hypothetical protein